MTERRRDAADNRARILTAATGLFAARPAASLADVADVAGLTRTTVYRHFRSREALVNAVYVGALAQVESALAAARLADGGVPEAIDRALDAMLAAAGSCAVLVNGPSADVADPALVAGYDVALEPVVALARRGRRTGEMPPGLPDWWLADALFALVLAALTRVAAGDLAREDVRTLVRRTLGSGIA